MVKDKKVLPHLSSYANDPERIEEQANRMAKEGWLLEKFGSLFSTYRRGKAGEYEYRVQVKEAGIDRLTSQSLQSSALKRSAAWETCSFCARRRTARLLICTQTSIPSSPSRKKPCATCAQVCC